MFHSGIKNAIVHVVVMNFRRLVIHTKKQLLTLQCQLQKWISLFSLPFQTTPSSSTTQFLFESHTMQIQYRNVRYISIIPI